MIDKISILIEALKRDKPGVIMLALFFMMFQTEVYWQRMSCIGVMLVVFLIRNLGKIKDDKNGDPD